MFIAVSTSARHWSLTKPHESSPLPPILLLKNPFQHLPILRQFLPSDLHAFLFAPVTQVPEPNLIQRRA
jgi:hypothetical protein